MTRTATAPAAAPVTGTADLRCPHCLMSADVTADGITTAHDYPYAVYAYGPCNGSGRAPLAGPATPPPAWGAATDRDFVQLGVLPSPLPHVIRDGWTVTLTGVRFTHTRHCPKCRQAVSTATDGGTIRHHPDRLRQPGAFLRNPSGRQPPDVRRAMPERLRPSTRDRHQPQPHEPYRVPRTAGRRRADRPVPGMGTPARRTRRRHRRHDTPGHDPPAAPQA